MSVWRRLVDLNIAPRQLSLILLCFLNCPWRQFWTRADLLYFKLLVVTTTTMFQVSILSDQVIHSIRLITSLPSLFETFFYPEFDITISNLTLYMLPLFNNISLVTFGSFFNFVTKLKKLRSSCSLQVFKRWFVNLLPSFLNLAVVVVIKLRIEGLPSSQINTVIYIFRTHALHRTLILFICQHKKQIPLVKILSITSYPIFTFYDASMRVHFRSPWM